jgi:hypothetical protein
VENVTIVNGSVDVTGVAGIGAGHAVAGRSSVGSVTLRNRSYALAGEVGIGGVPLLTFGSATIGLTSTLVQFTCQASSGTCLTGGQLSLSGVNVKGVTNSTNFAGGWTGPASLQYSDFIGQYQTKSTKDSFGTLSMLHLGQITMPSREVYRLTVREHGSTMVLRTIQYSAAGFEGIIFSIAPGTYEVLVDDPEGHLCHKKNTVFEVPSGAESFYDDVTLCTTGDGLSTAATVGITVVAVLVACGIGATVYCVVRRKKTVPIVENSGKRKGDHADHILETESANPPSYTGAEP